MKNRYYLLIACVCALLSANAQEYRRWGVAVHGGMPIMQGDGDVATLAAAGGLSFKYVFANNFSVRVSGMFGQMKSKNLDATAYRSTTNYTEGVAQANLNLVNFKKMSTGRNIAQLYLGAGVGYAMASLTYEPANAGKADAQSLVIPYGVGMKFYISPLVDVGLEFSQRMTFTDFFDGYSPAGGNNKANDFYALPQAYVAFNLGGGGNKNARSLEWVEPTEKLYEELIKAKQEAQDQINNLKKENAQLSDKMKADMQLQMADNKRRSDSLILAVKESFKNDSDGDGVSDVFDKEPNTPAGASVDGAGRMMDSDKDGTPDFKDKCPTVPGKENNNGCPVQPTKQQLSIISDGIKNLTFETGKAVIQPSSFPALNRLADLLLENTSFNFRIDGHTDNVGDPSKNMLLSQERADAVKMFLVNKGVDASRITATGYGDTKPVVSNATAAGKAKNRRVDMAIE